jgi:hypothetical protein
MRKLIFRLMALFAVAQWLGTVDILVLITGMAAVIAGLVCVDLLVNAGTARAAQQ